MKTKIARKSSGEDESSLDPIHLLQPVPAPPPCRSDGRQQLRRAYEKEEEEPDPHARVSARHPHLRQLSKRSSQRQLAATRKRKFGDADACEHAEEGGEPMCWQRRQ
eukprot:767985-Hanusia_phi.AAC.1